MSDFPIIWDFSILRASNNTTWHQVDNLSKSEGICVQIVYVIMCFFGTTGNFITIVALVKNPGLRKKSNTKFVVSLSISDMLTCLTIMPIWIVLVRNSNITFVETICSFSVFFHYATQSTSLITLMAISINKYVMICHKTIYHRIYTTQNVALMIIFTWLFTFGLFALPLVRIWGKIDLAASNIRCDILPENYDKVNAKKFFFIFFFLLPLFIMTICYIAIFIKIRRMKKEIQEYFSNHKDTDWELLKMMTILFVCYILGALPILITNLIDPLMLHNRIHIIPRMLIAVQAIINPFIYAFNNKVYQPAYQKLFQDISRTVCQERSETRLKSVCQEIKETK